MKTPRLVRGVFFAFRKNLKTYTNPVRAAEGCDLLNSRQIKKSQPSAAPTGAFAVFEHEAFVMKLNGLRLNVAYFKACGIFSDSATVPFQTQSFT
ncbi:hypothetical protein [Pseudomonas azerbaijanoccidentalis]